MSDKKLWAKIGTKISSVVGIITGTAVGDKNALDVFVQSGTVTGELTPTGLKNGGLHTEVTIDHTDWYPLPASNLTSRNQINVQNFSGAEVKINHGSVKPVVGYVGMRIPDQNERFYQITDGITIWARAEPLAGSIVLDVEEIS